MVTFRYHIVSLVATFLALAGGIALGAGPLQEPVRGQLAATGNADGDATELAARLEAAERLGSFQSDYGAGTAPLVLDGRLDRTSVCLVVLPGADAGTVRAIEADLALADANLVSRVTLSADLVDPAGRQLAEGLAQRVLARVEGADVAEGATSYSLVGAALARAFLTRSTEAVTQDSAAESIDAAFVEAALLQVGAVEGRAELALVVAGAPDPAAPEGQDAAAAQLVGGLDRYAGGTVVVGPPDSGVVAAVRDSSLGDDVTTVDAGQTPAGRVVSVLALTEQAAGGTGHYGLDAADGALPDPAA